MGQLGALQLQKVGMMCWLICTAKPWHSMVHGQFNSQPDLKMSTTSVAGMFFFEFLIEYKRQKYCAQRCLDVFAVDSS